MNQTISIGNLLSNLPWNNLPDSIYLFKVNNENAKTLPEIISVVLVPFSLFRYFYYYGFEQVNVLF